jgi:YD repeat-containing protein
MSPNKCEHTLMKHLACMFLLLIAKISVLVAPVYATPRYIIEIQRDEYYEYEENPPAAGVHVYSTIHLENDSGVFSNSLKVSGQGLSSDNFFASTITDTVTLYIRGTQGNIPWRLTKTSTGEVSAGTSENGFMGLASYPSANLRWQVNSVHDFSGPNLWAYQPSGLQASTKTQSVNEMINSTGTTNNIATNFPAYPGISYYYVAGPILKAQVRRRWYGSPGQFQASGSNPSASVNVNYSFNLSVEPPKKRKREPGNTRGPKKKYQCPGAGNGGSANGAGGTGADQNPLVEITQNIGTGNVMVTTNDPIPTRGYPLTNRIHVNSQVVDTDRPMGNAAFSYDIHLTSQELPSPSGEANIQYRILVDGDGQRLNFGPILEHPIPEPGVFSLLRQTDKGFELVNAGPPEEIRKAGNFSYIFDPSGRLLSISDAAGNKQTLNYSSGLLTSVIDESSKKYVEYRYLGNKISQVIENGGNANTSISYSGDYVRKIELFDDIESVFKIEYTYDDLNRLYSITRDSNAASTYTLSYQSQNSIEPGAIVDLASVIWPTGAAHTIYNLDSEQNISRTTVSNYSGGSITYDFDSDWNLVKLTFPRLHRANSPLVYSYSYDTDRNLRTFSNGKDSRTFEYTPNGLLHKIIQPNEYFKQFNYNGVNLTSIADSIGPISTLRYENTLLPNLPTHIEDALNNVWSYTYNQHGQITKITPPVGSPVGSTSFIYDESSSTSPYYGWLKSVTDGEGNKISIDSYNTIGDITAISSYIDPADNTTQQSTTFSYDTAHRVKIISHPDGSKVMNSYKGSNLDYFEDEAKKRTSYKWCNECSALTTVKKEANAD